MGKYDYKRNLSIAVFMIIQFNCHAMLFFKAKLTAIGFLFLVLEGKSI
jgi:hypothetical protein